MTFHADALNNAATRIKELEGALREAGAMIGNFIPPSTAVDGLLRRIDRLQGASIGGQRLLVVDMQHPTLLCASCGVVFFRSDTGGYYHPPSVGCSRERGAVEITDSAPKYPALKEIPK